MNPTDDEINDTLRRLEQTKMEIVDDTPPWQSDAEREGLGVVNVHDVKGAPVLDRDAILRASYPNQARK